MFDRRPPLLTMQVLLASLVAMQLAACGTEGGSSVHDQSSTSETAPSTSSSSGSTSSSGTTSSSGSSSSASGGSSSSGSSSSTSGGSSGTGGTPTPALAPVPANVAATVGSASIDVTWTASKGATSYDVKRATTSGGPYSQLATTTTPAYTDSKVVTGVTYYYVITAVDAAGSSANSAQVSALLPTPAPKPVVTSISLTPANAALAPDGTKQFSASALDQNGKAMSPQPTIVWTASRGAVSSAGLFTAPSSSGSATITAEVVSTDVSATATVTVAAAGTCASLPASGAWDATSVSPVTPPAEPSYVQTGKPMAIAIDPFNPATVWLGTGNSGLYKSTNCGAAGSWVKIDTGTNHAALDGGSIWSIAVDPDPSRQGVIYVTNSYAANGGVWKSTNGGVDWVQLQIGSSSALSSSFQSNVSMDAANTLHIAVTTHGAAPGYSNGAIAESFDGGNTWPNIVAMPAAWGEEGGIYLVPGTSNGTTSTWVWGTGWADGGTFVTTNSGVTWPTQDGLSSAADALIGEHNILPLQKASNGWYYVPAKNTMLKSEDGVKWSAAWSEKNYAAPSPDAFAITGSTIYAGSNQTLYSAPLNNDSNWTVMPNPPKLTSMDYFGFLAYDSAHGILYLSTWNSVFRYTVPSSSR